ncbi:MAG: GxGYxYP family putative glycoside hydrolase [Massilibacteroides sp.]|nr:GxGYxYP family putative glycoside hydrolase [Massilibacteroides sp.]MDD3062399.1 GxGYxYP family putative glycoside hydrolase [Massilibacteroides sp.]MDD4115685.1 GxGYxYP family putative glycoside hydrolase [Massilibacteroides sp.]
MKKIMTINLISLLIFVCFSSCSRKIKYEEIYDPIQDVGQFQLPSLNKTPSYCWFLKVNAANSNQALKEHILATSIAGLTTRAMQEGKTDVGIWINNNKDKNIAYQVELQSLKERGCHFLDMISPVELATKEVPPHKGAKVSVKDLFDGYILIDMDSNPESGAVAVTASHVYNGLIVDKEFKEIFEEAGYKMLYDASKKNVRDAWTEFGHKCATNGLVIMPNDTWELKDVAIQHGWFFMNLYVKPHSSDKGDYWDLYEHVCTVLDNHTWIYGWEEGPHDERGINGMASENAHATAINDWFYNYCLTNADYRNRQESILAKVLNPKTIDYHKNKRLVSYYMSDGDNNQWMMGGFIEHWYDVSAASANKIAFGINTTAMPQMAPAAYKYLLERQPENTTLIEVQGGCVFYCDTYGEKKNRKKQLRERARMTAAHMRQHRIKVLGLMAKDSVGSGKAQEAYQMFIEENDQLIGIVALQYTPYAGGKGDIYWFENKEGYSIPVITVKYSLWNEPLNRAREGTPKYIADCLDGDSHNPDFNLVCIHAWSRFSDQGKDCDELAETKPGEVMGSDIATLLTNHLDDTYEVVSVEEMIWQLRMKYYPEQTKKYLDSLM